MGSAFLKTGVISANFKLSVNLPVTKDPFKSFSNMLAVAFELILTILWGRLTLVDDWLGLMSLIYFTTSLKATGSNENLFWLSAFLLIAMILRWYLYIFMALWARSSTFWKFWFMILKFSLISNVETAFFKKVFNSSAVFYHFVALHLFSRVLCYFQNFLYLRKIVCPFSKITYYHWQKRDLVC